MLKVNAMFNKQFIHINKSYSYSPEVRQEMTSGKFWMKLKKKYFYLPINLDVCKSEWVSDVLTSDIHCWFIGMKFHMCF